MKLLLLNSLQIIYLADTQVYDSYLNNIFIHTMRSVRLSSHPTLSLPKKRTS